METANNNLALENGDRRTKDRLASWFLFLCLVSGFLIAYFTPPMCTPDENAHFLNAYAVSRGDFFPEVVDGALARYPEERVLGFVWKYNSRFVGNLSDKYSFSEQYFNSYLNDDRTGPALYPSTLNNTNPISYIPAALSMWIGRSVGEIFGFSLVSLPYNLLMLGRIGNLLFYAIVIYFALRITPGLQRVMMMLALMPMAMFLGASVNYDAILISVSFLFVAEVGKLITEPAEKRISGRDIACILFCTFFLVGVKQAYATLLLMLLAVPRKKYGSTRNLILCICSVLFTGVIAYLPTIIIGNISSTAAGDASAAVIAEQNEYVRTHLSEMPGIFFNSIKYFKGFYLEGFWGKLGQLDTNIPLPFAVIFYCLLILVSVTDALSVKLWDKQWKRSFPFAAVLISIIGIFGIMYLTWTPLPGIADGVGTQYVSGVQGRYLIQLFIPAVSVFCVGKFAERKFVRKLNFISNRIIYAWSAVCALLTPIVIFTRYW